MKTTEHIEWPVGKQVSLVEKIAENYARITFTDGSILMIEAETLYLPSAGTIATMDLSKGTDSASLVEERHDVLCNCGWGRLGCPESEIPAHCPMCGYGINPIEEVE